MPDIPSGNHKWLIDILQRLKLSEKPIDDGICVGIAAFSSYVILSSGEFNDKDFHALFEDLYENKENDEIKLLLQGSAEIKSTLDQIKQPSQKDDLMLIPLEVKKKLERRAQLHSSILQMISYFQNHQYQLFGPFPNNNYVFKTDQKDMPAPCQLYALNKMDPEHRYYSPYAFSDVFTEKSLYNFLHQIKRSAISLSYPFPLVLNFAANGHALVVSFLAENKWILIDANHLSVEQYDSGSENVLVSNILRYLFSVDKATISITLCAKESHSEKINQVLTCFINRNSTIINREITPEKILYKPTEKSFSWAYAAICSREAFLLKKILSFKLFNSNGIQDNLLHDAIESGGSIEIVKVLLTDPSVDPNFIVKDRTPLMLSCVRGDRCLAITKLLLSHPDIEINKNANLGMTALHAACVADNNNSIETIKLLLDQKNINCNPIDSMGTLPITAAIFRSSFEVSRLLMKDKRVACNEYYSAMPPLIVALREAPDALQKAKQALFLLKYKKIDPNCRYENQTPLYLACWYGLNTVVKKLLSDPRTKPDIFFPFLDSKTPLSAAVEQGHEEIVKLLLMHSVDPNGADPNSLPPLYIACMHNKISIVKTLLSDKRTNVNHVNKTGSHYLYISVQEGHLDIVKLLLKHPKLDAKQTFFNQNSALTRSISQQHVQIAEILIKDGRFDLNYQNQDGDTPLNATIRLNLLYITKLLLSYSNLDVNLPVANGNTPLINAILNDRQQVIDLLLTDDRLDINAVGELGHTAFYSAVDKNDLKLVKRLLTEETLDPTLCDNNDMSPLSIAVLKGYTEIVKLLIQDPRINPSEKTQHTKKEKSKKAKKVGRRQQTKKRTDPNPQGKRNRYRHRPMKQVIKLEVVNTRKNAS